MEVGDAPDGPVPNQTTTGVGPLTGITGSVNGFFDGSGDHVDSFAITITDVNAFYATTAFGNGFANFASSLWLWDNVGNSLLGNANARNIGPGSTISDPTTFPGLTGGAVDPTASGIELTADQMYILSVSYFSNEARDTGNNTVIDLNSLFSELHGPNCGPPPCFDHWDNDATDGGDYHIELAGAEFYSPVPIPTPIPAALPLFATALAGLGFVAKRRKQAA